MPIGRSFAGIAERAEVLVLAGRDVEPHDLRAVGILHPGLAVDLRCGHREVRLLRGVALPFLGNRVHAEGLGLAIEPRKSGLVHEPDPDIAVLVDFEVEGALRMIRLLHRDRIVRRLPRLRIHLGEELFAEMREPDHAVGIDDDVMGLDLPPRQIVFRDDDLGGAALGARKLLDLERMRRASIQVDAREIFGEFLRDGGRHRRTPVLADQPLRLQVRGPGIIAGHPLEHLEEVGFGMPRLENPLQRVAVRAVEHHPFDLVGARRAHHPFGVGDLLGARLGGNEREVRNRRLALGEVDIRRALECVAGSTDGQRVPARLQRETQGSRTRPWHRSRLSP